jgi:hypothetical protein
MAVQTIGMDMPIHVKNKNPDKQLCPDRSVYGAQPLRCYLPGSDTS